MAITNTESGTNVCVVAQGIWRINTPVAIDGGGADALTETDILEPSEDFRRAMDYYAHSPDTRQTLARLAGTQPRTLACMHGSA